jgi:hypothetical protein
LEGGRLPALGWRHRRHYDMRATFITLAIDDGADPDVLETRVTHTRKSRNASRSPWWRWPSRGGARRRDRRAPVSPARPRWRFGARWRWSSSARPRGARRGRAAPTRPPTPPARPAPLRWCCSPIAAAATAMRRQAVGHEERALAAARGSGLDRDIAQERQARGLRAEDVGRTAAIGSTSNRRLWAVRAARSHRGPHGRGQGDGATVRRPMVFTAEWLMISTRREVLCERELSQTRGRAAARAW